MSSSHREQVAVLGGGLAALTTAYELTELDGWRDRFDLTVYQMGWRLGGKGAAGRNAAVRQRVEEHGLHLFFGFYDNAFDMMRRCYDALGRGDDEPLSSWDEAFRPRRSYVLMETVDGRKVPWRFEMPDMPGTPGDHPPGPTTPWDFLRELVPRAAAYWRQLAGDDAEADRATRDRAGEGLLGSLVDGVVDVAEDLAEALGRVSEHAFLRLVEERLEQLGDAPETHDEREHALLARLLERFRDALASWAGPHEELGDALRRGCLLLELGVTVARGMLADGLLKAPVDWFALDDERFEDWLRRHGASEEAVRSPVVRMMMDVAFAREPGVGAGTCLHYAMQFALGYRGAFGYEMVAGMGDVVAAPLYEVLSQRGVRFRFFHRVDALELSDDGDRIERIRMGRQAMPKDATYDPLVEVDGLPAWPNEPKYDLLAEGEALRDSGADLEDWWTSWQDVDERVLQRGRDFDSVVLGISVGAFPDVCRELLADRSNPRFRRMVEGLRTTQTQAVQLWLNRGLDALGWEEEPPVLGTFREPFDTWADLSEVLHYERWGPDEVRSLAYWVSAMDDDEPPPPPSQHGYAQRQQERVKRHATAWMEEHLHELWPEAAEPGRFDWSALVDPAGREGVRRFEAQYWRAPKNPSERYVLSVPGSVDVRLRADEAGYDNLVLAGDWTRTPLSAGAAEAAVMSGRMAARTLARDARPVMRDWLGEDHRPARAADLPAYVDLDGNNTPVPPYRAGDALTHVFALPADMQRLQALCDRTLNLGGRTVYRPLAPVALFVAAHMRTMAPARPDVWIPERDYGFWLPVVAGREGDEGFTAERALVHVPCLWVDTHLAAQAGREVFGFPKGVGELTGPSRPEDDPTFGIEALAAAEPGPIGQPDSEWRMRTIVEARRLDGAEVGGREASWGGLAQAARELVGALRRRLDEVDASASLWNLLEQLLSQTREPRVPMVFLKQFRDAEAPTRACYQAILEAPMTLGSRPVRGGWLEGEYELTLPRWTTSDVAGHLGLRTDDAGRIRSVLQWWLAFDYVARPGEVIWEAGPDANGSRESTR